MNARILLLSMLILRLPQQRLWIAGAVAGASADSKAAAIRRAEFYPQHGDPAHSMSDHEFAKIQSPKLRNGYDRATRFDLWSIYSLNAGDERTYHGSPEIFTGLLIYEAL